MSLRVMEQRARDAGYAISRSQINAYEHAAVATRPSRDVVEGLAAALGVSFEEVVAAVEETYRLDVDTGRDKGHRQTQRAQAWLRLTGERTDDEVNELLMIVEQILRMRDMDGP